MGHAHPTRCCSYKPLNNHCYEGIVRMILYNLFPLLAGKFSDWTPHLERAADLGFDWIFVNPVQKTGSSGSLYSVADYLQLNPLLVDQSAELAPDEQLKAAIKTAESLGLKMMIDLVINHCAFDSPVPNSTPTGSSMNRTAVSPIPSVSK